MQPPKIGVRLRIGAGGIAAATFVDLAAAVERAGADALFLNGDRPGEQANDPFVLLGAAAASTSRIGLGCLSSSVEERSPALLAKTLAALDLCCGGRAIACITADFTRGGDPAGTLVEAVAVVRAMLEVAAPTFHGEHFSITRAWNEPRMPREQPMPIGVAIGPAPSSEPTGTLQAAGIVAGLAEGADFLVVDWRSNGAKPASGATPVLALADASSIAGVEEATRSACCAGFAGVVLDFLQVPEPNALIDALGAARKAGS